ncbi:hypothetical protein EJ02DRAFT_515297 [Clathrospora elynae]|uniref:Uncharacterized protein n=1 Tax=Clathrospora elynae TaxID=706981 RepID=A0A6A5SCK8_9PLEO|nr:hypothetical protein EJ02DRAFT_515297 [Clathrospora elynae]
MKKNIGTARGRTARAVSSASSDTSELTALSRSPSLVPEYDTLARGRTSRAASPAPSAISELTVLSRSPSPVPGYEYVVVGRSEHSTAEQPLIPRNKNRGGDGRFVSRRMKRARSQSRSSWSERPPKRSRRSTVISNTPNRRTRKYTESASFAPDPTSPMPWAVGKGDFGTLDVLPMEIRQEIYCLAFDTDRPVTVKECCGPDTTKRERDACRKHGMGTKLGAGRLNILQVSKAMREEALWVVFSRGSLSLEVSSAIDPYIKGYRLMRLRGTASFIQHDTRKTTMWTTAAQFRFVRINVSENTLQYGDPTVYTDHLLGIATLLCKSWQQQVGPVVTKAVHLNLDSVFHQLLPFNLESQGADRYGELLDWLYTHHPNAEPDLDKLGADAAHNLQRLVLIAGKYPRYPQWKVFVKTQLDEQDRGGAKALRAFQVGCAKNGVVFEHSG